MKINTAKIRVNSVMTKVTLIFMCALMAIALPLEMTKKASADVYDDQISALQEEIRIAQEQADLMAAQANTYQNAVNKIQNQINITQTQINISQAQYNKLIAEIANTESSIKDNQDAMGKTIADMYVDDNITPLEMLASSKSIGDYLDKQEYRASIRNQLTETIAKIKELKAQLEQQRADVETVLNKQKAERASLAAAQQEQQNLLAQTQGLEAAYQQLVSSARQKVEAVAAQQRAYYQSLINSGGDGSSGVEGSFEWVNWSGSQGCSGGYPSSAYGYYGGYWGCAYAKDNGVDSWQLFNRECVSYAAWAISERFGRYVSPFWGSGMAYEWPSSAVRYSGAVRVYNPQPGDAVVLPASDNFAPVGHLMVVESFDGTWIHVSQYNMYGDGQYSTMDIKNSGIILLRFPSA